MSVSKAVPQELGRIWQSVTAATYARYMIECEGAKLVKVGDTWWYRVRPFFYRPILPFQPCKAPSAKSDLGRFAAFQHGVTQGESCNSYLNLIMFEDVREYEIRKLDKTVRYDLRSALKNDVVVAPISDPDEYCDQAYQAFLSFYDRTKYEYVSKRRDHLRFVQWWRSLFDIPELVTWGAFHRGTLISFEIGLLVEDTFMLTTRVHSDHSLKQRVPDLMLHSWRVAARDAQNVARIFDSLLVGRPGVNFFKLHRGARVIAHPANLHVNPLVLSALKLAQPHLHNRLVGLGPEEVGSLMGGKEHLHLVLPLLLSDIETYCASVPMIF